MSNAKAEVYAGIYEAAVKATVGVVEKVPEDQRTRQVQDGKAHPLWLLGHLTYSLDMFVNLWALDGQMNCPPEYGKMFGPAVAGGDPVKSDASAYPAWDDLVDIYKKSGAAVVDAIKNLEDGDLSGDLKGPVPDSAKGFFGDLEQTLAGMGGHDSYHRGQMGMLSALG